MEMQFVHRIEPKHDFSRPGPLVWRDPDTDTLYRRVVGGLAWPWGFADGALVVLVERFRPLPGQRVRRVDVAAEYTDEDPEALLRRASLWGETLHCGAWMTPLDAPEMQLAFDYDAERRLKRLPQLDLSMPPAVNGSRDFAAYQRLLERRTRSLKTVFFGEHSLVGRAYAARQRLDLTRPVAQFPLIAAFLWALASIDLFAAAAGAEASDACVADDVAGY